jgi:hypothetical protein
MPSIHDQVKCFKSFAHFVDAYLQIYDATSGEWSPFRLWPRQIEVANALSNNRIVVILKARQLGMTWLCLAYALWLMIFRPAATILIFCRTDREAVYLLGSERLRGMWERLPNFLKSGLTVTDDSDHTWALSNGSIARALPAGAGDAFTVTYCLVDEADICPDLNDLLRRAKPTIDAGGRMTLLSRSNKSAPQSTFKHIYRAAARGENDWTPIFLPWMARPSRDAAWYEAQRRDVLARTGALDDLWEQYPETAEQALRAAQKDKRLAAEWFEQTVAEQAPLTAAPGDPAVPGLRIYARPIAGRSYVIGADPGEGNPGSDPSAFCVLDGGSGEQVAAFDVPVQITTFANYLDLVGTWYWRAPLMVERVNHGHAVLLWLWEHSKLRQLTGHDGKPGWLSSSLGKTLLYNATADAIRNAEVMLHDADTVAQLQSIEGATLLAPKNEHDDAADAFALACAGRAQAVQWSFEAIGGAGKRTDSRWKPPS